MLLNSKNLRTDQILNEILKLITGEICSYLEQTFNDFLTVGHNFLNFEESIVVILPQYKGKIDETSLKIDQTISLLNRIGKIIGETLAVKISFINTAHKLQLNIHFGGQRRS